jgi:hypothetical protein
MLEQCHSLNLPGETKDAAGQSVSALFWFDASLTPIFPTGQAVLGLVSGKELGRKTGKITEFLRKMDVKVSSFVSHFCS